MFTKPSQVIIGKRTAIEDHEGNVEIDNLAIGDITVVNEDMHPVSSGSGEQALYIGVCTGKQTITLPDGTIKEVSIMQWSDKLEKDSNAKYSVRYHSDPVNAKIEFDLTNAEIVKGHRYVLRVLYKDMNIANFQFTHTYEHVATSEVADDLGNALLQKINKHANRRVNATYASGKLTLTAMDKDYDNSVESLDEYSIVSMDASLYVTIPGALLSNQPETVIGVEINKTEGNPGKGFWKQVRDAELRAMGYRGIVKTGAYPSIEQERRVTKGAKYNQIYISFDKKYLSPDNQYIKTTPVMVEIFCEGDLGFLQMALMGFGMTEIAEPVETSGED